MDIIGKNFHQRYAHMLELKEEDRIRGLDIWDSDEFYSVIHIQRDYIYGHITATEFRMHRGIKQLRARGWTSVEYNWDERGNYFDSNGERSGRYSFRRAKNTTFKTESSGIRIDLENLEKHSRNIGTVSQEVGFMGIRGINKLYSEFKDNHGIILVTCDSTNDKYLDLEDLPLLYRNYLAGGVHHDARQVHQIEKLCFGKGDKPLQIYNHTLLKEDGTPIR